MPYLIGVCHDTVVLSRSTLHHSDNLKEISPDVSWKPNAASCQTISLKRVIFKENLKNPYFQVAYSSEVIFQLFTFFHRTTEILCNSFSLKVFISLERIGHMSLTCWPHRPDLHRQTFSPLSTDITYKQTSQKLPFLLTKGTKQGKMENTAQISPGNSKCTVTHSASVVPPL